MSAEEMNPLWTIDDDTPMEHPTVSGGPCGYVPRDLTVQPAYGATVEQPSFIKVYPRSEWSERIKEKKAKKSRNSDIWRRRGPGGAPIPRVTQGSSNYCWGHSATNAAMGTRGKMNLPFKALSAFAMCSTIMGGANQGGWAALVFDRAMKFGWPEQSLWPQGDFRVKPWTGTLAENAALNMLEEGWWDAGTQAGLRKLSVDQVVSLLLDNYFVPVEYNWWRHSVLGMDVDEPNPSLDLMDPNRWCLDILNSWVGWGNDIGMGRLLGSKWRPDTAVAMSNMKAA